MTATSRQYVVVNRELSRVYVGTLAECYARALQGWQWAGSVPIALEHVREHRTKAIPSDTGLRLHLAEGGV
jgi:hypothetical protein